MAAPNGEQSFANHGPPYAPQFQPLGEVPSIIPDVPVNVIFLLLFLSAGIGHFLLLRRNQINGKKFVVSIMVGIFCLTRVIATCLRIAWACNPIDIHVGITATVFVYAGIVLLYLANFLFAQRIVRAQHPPLGWSKPCTVVLPILFIITIGTVLCLIAAVIVSFYTLSGYSLHTAREIQKFGSTMLAIIAFLPFVIVGTSSLARRHPTIRETKTTDKSGDGSTRAKVAICLTSSGLLSFGAWFRAAATLHSPTAITEPAPWYLSKAIFYVFNFTIEVIVVFLWLGVRVDKRFYIPDGASGPCSNAGSFVFAGEFSNEKRRSSHLPPSEQDPAGRRSSLRLSMSRQEFQHRSSQHRRSISSPRLSLPGTYEAKLAQQEKIARRVSWGGVGREDVKAGMGEDKKELPYPAFENGGRYGEDPSDINIEGVDKEMGWDPKSGKWAVRPISALTAQEREITSLELREEFRQSLASGWRDPDEL